MDVEKWAEKYRDQGYTPVMFRDMTGFQRINGSEFGTFKRKRDLVENRFYVSSLVEQYKHCMPDIKNVVVEYVSYDFGDVFRELVLISFYYEQFHFEVRLEMQKKEDHRYLTAEHKATFKNAQKSQRSQQEKKFLTHMLESSLKFLEENSKHRLDLLTHEYTRNFNGFEGFATKG